MPSGRVKWFNPEKGYGILSVQDGIPEDLFVEHTAIEMEGYKTLEEGQEVEFEIVQARLGPQARAVRVVIRV